MGFEILNILNYDFITYTSPGTHLSDEPNNLRRSGCQIDYLIQTRTNTLYACEIKVQTKSLGTEVIEEMTKKFRALALPKGFGFCPVLLYLGPISESLERQNYFYRTIDIADFINSLT